jgi:hypothetical protein
VVSQYLLGKYAEEQPQADEVQVGQGCQSMRQLPLYFSNSLTACQML